MKFTIKHFYLWLLKQWSVFFFFAVRAFQPAVAEVAIHHSYVAASAKKKEKKEEAKLKTIHPSFQLISFWPQGRGVCWSLSRLSQSKGRGETMGRSILYSRAVLRAISMFSKPRVQHDSGIGNGFMDGHSPTLIHMYETYKEKVHIEFIWSLKSLPLALIYKSFLVALSCGSQQAFWAEFKSFLL